MICEILLPLPINKTFYYVGERSNKDLFKGSLVEVEFKKKVIVGVVINFIKSTTLRKPLKKINKVLNPFFLNSEIMRSINFISQYSCNQSSMILKMFLSNFPIKASKMLLGQNKIKKKN